MVQLRATLQVRIKLLVLRKGTLLHGLLKGQCAFDVPAAAFFAVARCCTPITLVVNQRICGEPNFIEIVIDRRIAP